MITIREELVEQRACAQTLPHDFQWLISWILHSSSTLIRQNTINKKHAIDTGHADRTPNNTIPWYQCASL